MVSNPVCERSVAKSEIIRKHSLPTTCIPLRSRRITVCSNAVESWCQRKRAAKLNKGQRLWTIVWITALLETVIMTYALATKTNENSKKMESRKVFERNVAKSNKLWKHSLPATRILPRPQRVAGCTNAVQSWFLRARAAKTNYERR